MAGFNLLDLVLVLALVVALIGGLRLGLVARALSWLGLLVGAGLTLLAIPAVVDALGGRGQRAGLGLFVLALLVAGGLVGQALGLLAGSRLRVRVRSRSLRRTDAAGGGLAGLAGMVAIIWLLIPVFAEIPGWQAEAARGSRIARVIDDALPQPPDPARTVRRLLGDAGPRVFDSLRPAPDLASPPAASGLDEATARAVAASTVKVSGEACGRIQQGTGFVVAPERVVTNAHVVAGEATTELRRDDGVMVPARVVGFDGDRDLALLVAPGLDRSPLPIGGTSVGERGAGFGHPRGGPLRIAPFAVADRTPAVGTDIYGNPGVRRRILVLAAELEPGDSGSALVDPAGEVVGVAFAVAPDRNGVAYGLTTAELSTFLAATDAATPAPTGVCLT